jgi:hypothetical protein
MESDERRRVKLGDILRIDIPKLHTAVSEGAEAGPAARVILRILHEPKGKYKLRVLYCPALPLLWGFRPGDGSAASAIHQAYARELWRERGFTGRLGILLHFLVWPPFFLGTLIWFTALNGHKIRRQTGKGIIRQLREQLWLAIRHGIFPPWYYMFELFDDTRYQRAGQYLRRDETKGGAYPLLRTRSKNISLSNKITFANLCERHGIRTPDHLEAKSGHLLQSDKQPATSLPRADLFAKPSHGRGGCRTESWRYDGSHWSRDGAPPIDEVALMEHFRALSKDERYLIQRRLFPHPDLAGLSGEILTTIRMVTIRDEAGGFEATHAVYRMPSRPGASVDNFHAGGLAAKIDLETGELGPASDIGLHPSSEWHETHPISGAQIEGLKMPFWKESVDLARRAHAAIPRRAVIGWDIAVVDDGPVVIEGNGRADLDIIQRAHREPIGDSRFGELLAHHLEARASQGQATASD